MTIYWVRTENNNALLAMEAVAQALEVGDTGTPEEPERFDLSAGDPYLAENLAQLNSSWSVDPNEIVVSSRPGLGQLINLVQRVVRRVTWWYTLPQWQRVMSFHATSVRTINSILEHMRQLRKRIDGLESGLTPVTRTQLLEEQIHLLRLDLVALQSRVAELEAELARVSDKR